MTYRVRISRTASVCIASLARLCFRSESDESGISSAESDDDISSGNDVDENVRQSVKAALGHAAPNSDADVCLISTFSFFLHVCVCI